MPTAGVTSKTYSNVGKDWPHGSRGRHGHQASKAAHTLQSSVECSVTFAQCSWCYLHVLLILKREACRKFCISQIVGCTMVAWNKHSTELDFNPICPRRGGNARGGGSYVIWKIGPSNIRLKHWALNHLWLLKSILSIVEFLVWERIITWKVGNKKISVTFWSNDYLYYFAS